MRPAVFKFNQYIDEFNVIFELRVYDLNVLLILTKKILEVQDWFHEECEDPSADVWFSLTAEVLEEFRAACTAMKTSKSIPSLTSGKVASGPAPPAAWRRR